MPLSKQVSHESGINPSYWKILSLNIHKKNGFAAIMVGCFISAPSGSVKEPLVIKNIIVKGADFGMYYSSDVQNNYIKQSYLYLKTLPEFEGASDIDV